MKIWPKGWWYQNLLVCVLLYTRAVSKGLPFWNVCGICSDCIHGSACVKSVVNWEWKLFLWFYNLIHLTPIGHTTEMTSLSTHPTPTWFSGLFLRCLVILILYWYAAIFKQRLLILLRSVQPYQFLPTPLLFFSSLFPPKLNVTKFNFLVYFCCCLFVLLFCYSIKWKSDHASASCATRLRIKGVWEWRAVYQVLLSYPPPHPPLTVVVVLSV